MKKTIACLLTGAMLLSVAACGKGSGDGTEVTEVSNTYGKVDLCTYKGLDGELQVHEITEDEVQEQISAILDENEQQISLDRGAKNGDYVEFYFTAKVGDETIYDFSKEVYYMTLGEEEFGSEFDKKLKGAKAKDHKTFTIKYDDTYWDEQLQNKEVAYDVTMDGVYELKTPELTEDFIKDTLGYSSEEDMRKQVKEQLQEEYDSTAQFYTQSDLLQKVIEGSNITEYNDDLYNDCKEQVQSEYEANMELLGCDSVDQVYEQLGMSDEDVEDEILFYVYQQIVVQQIADEENLSISDDEYKTGLEEYAASAEYESAEDYEKEMGKDTVKFLLLRDKVMQFLQDNAKIKEVEGETLAQQQGMDDSDDEAVDETEIDEEIDGIEVDGTEIE